jgi:hypothetical protein
VRLGLAKARSIIADPRSVVLEGALSARGDEGIALEIEVLVLGRDASIPISMFQRRVR